MNHIRTKFIKYGVEKDMKRLFQLFVVSSLFLILNACRSSYEINNELDSDTFDVEIIEIHNTPQRSLEEGTILAKIVNESGHVTFNHLDLPSIELSIGDIVRITVHSPWNQPEPAPVVVIKWELIDNIE